MKKATLLAILPLLLAVPFRCTMAQAGSATPAVAGLERPAPTTESANSSVPMAPTIVAVSPDSGTTKTAKPNADTEATPNNANDDSVAISTYKVGVGDVLDIQWLNAANNRSTLYTVLEGGVIDVPIVGGPMSVGGLTTKDIQTQIGGHLKRLAMEKTTVAVTVRQYASHQVVITGLVGSPGTRFLRREAVPLYVLLAEVQPRSDASRATIMRSGAPSQVIDLSEAAALGVIVRPGDVINITSRPQEFYYIGGRVDFPGQKSFQAGITLVQAILAAGGSARNNVVELSREGAEGRLTTTKFNLKEIKSGKAEDPKLQAGDRIEVAH